MAAAQRRELHDVFELVVFDDDSTSSSSSEDEVANASKDWPLCKTFGGGGSEVRLPHAF